MESKAFRLLNSSMNHCLQPLSFRQNVPSLPIFYGYFHADNSIDLAAQKVQVFGGLLDETVQPAHACGEDIEMSKI